MCKSPRRRCSTARRGRMWTARRRTFRRRWRSMRMARATWRAARRRWASRWCTCRPIMCLVGRRALMRPVRGVLTWSRMKRGRVRFTVRRSWLVRTRCCGLRGAMWWPAARGCLGVGGANFAATMLRLASERDAVQVVSDQVGCPTWTGHLAPALLGLIERGVAGLVHLAGAGYVSWNEYAQEVFRQAEVACRVDDASTADMPRPAPRPAWSALESEREDVLPLPPWQDGVAGYLAARAGMMRP